MSARATAIAHANIALAKYWGKRAIAGNVPATPSVSLTLSGLQTRTTVVFDRAFEVDALELDGQLTRGRPLDRVSKLLDEVRALGKLDLRAKVTSENGFPTASGLASSASGFAALARAATAAANVELDDSSLSRLARRASASAARSIFGGFVALGTEDDAAAVPIAPASHWSIAMVVAAVTVARKEIGSTEAMERTRLTSPYFSAWIDDSKKLARDVVEAITGRDLERLGVAAEASALRMHACAMAASPPVLYWSPSTLELLSAVRALRASGVGAWATIDGGPHVKVICHADDAPLVVERVKPFCVRTIVARPGDGARVIEEGAS